MNRPYTQGYNDGFADGKARPRPRCSCDYSPPDGISDHADDCARSAVAALSSVQRSAKWEKSAKFQPGQYGLREVIAITCDGMVLAHVNTAFGEGPAVAKMITAAPGMAKALTGLLDWAREHTSPTDANSPHELLVAAQAELAKAGV